MVIACTKIKNRITQKIRNTNDVVIFKALKMEGDEFFFLNIRADVLSLQDCLNNFSFNLKQ